MAIKQLATSKGRDILNVSHDIFEKLVVGKVYRFGGRKGKVVSKELPNQKNARGRSVGLPVVTVDWKE